MSERELDLNAIRADAEKWRDRATAEGAYTDPKAEQTLALLNEIARLRQVIAAAGCIVCPRCEGQVYDVGACGLCRNYGWLRWDGSALGPYVQPPRDPAEPLYLGPL
jgi:hypothetical protein